MADARRDIEDIGGKKITCHNLKDFHARVSLEKQGIKKGILFCTYSLLITDRGGSRLQQGGRGDDDKDDLEAWKNSTASKSATYVASLQRQLPLARIVYLSATGTNVAARTAYC